MIDLKNPKIALALDFARIHHGEQKRKYTGEPYVTHPIEVAERISKFVQDQDVICAAILHDVVEDTPIKIEKIQKTFGDDIACYVWYLTKPPVYVGNREVRKRIDRDRLHIAPKYARLIKVFDIWHNSESIQENDPQFWEVFKIEALLLLDSMQAYNLVLEFCGQDFAENEFIDFIMDLA